MTQKISICFYFEVIFFSMFLLLIYILSHIFYYLQKSNSRKSLNTNKQFHNYYFIYYNAVILRNAVLLKIKMKFP